VRVVIAGCGRVGTDLARSLADMGHDVSVIDDRADVFKKLGSTFDGTTHTGRSYDVGVLRDAGIEAADAFIAVTNSDNANLMSVQLAKKVFGVGRTIARLDDPSRADAYQALDVQYVAGAKLTSRVILEQVVENEFHHHVSFPDGDVEIVDIVLAEGVVGLTVQDLEIEGALRVAAVRRNGTTSIPHDSYELKPHDLVAVAAKSGIRKRVRRFLRERETSL
jgi:trk/ktr system potassium uptake protein